MPFEPTRHSRITEVADSKAIGENRRLGVPHTVRRFTKARVLLLLLMALGACLFGCASPDTPIARHAIVPVAVPDLRAQQVGDTVVLSFTLPKISTDLQPLADVPTVEIYRNNPQAAALAPNLGKKNNKSRNTARLVDTIPGENIGQYQKNGRLEFADRLDPSELSSQNGTELIYTVRTRVSRAKDSADSNAAAIRVYPAPPQVRDLRVTITETALVLTWSGAQPTPSGSEGKAAGFQIYRAEADPAAATAAIADPSQAKLLAPPMLLAVTTGTEYRDTGFQFGRTYLYTVREVEQFGAESIESADSAPVVLTAQDIFPPAAPQGVEAIALSSINGAPAAIELTWTINAEPDLAGYNVYRSEQADMPGQRLNSELLLVPTFRDMSVAVGKRYFYRVGAVDQSGNESPLSSSVDTQIPQP